MDFTTNNHNNFKKKFPETQNTFFDIQHLNATSKWFNTVTLLHQIVGAAVPLYEKKIILSHNLFLYSRLNFIC